MKKKYIIGGIILIILLCVTIGLIIPKSSAESNGGYPIKVTVKATSEKIEGQTTSEGKIYVTKSTSGDRDEKQIDMSEVYKRTLDGIANQTAENGTYTFTISDLNDWSVLCNQAGEALYNNINEWADWSDRTIRYISEPNTGHYGYHGFGFDAESSIIEVCDTCYAGGETGNARVNKWFSKLHESKDENGKYQFPANKKAAAIYVIEYPTVKQRIEISTAGNTDLTSLEKIYTYANADEFGQGGEHSELQEYVWNGTVPEEARTYAETIVEANKDEEHLITMSTDYFEGIGMNTQDNSVIVGPFTIEYIEQNETKDFATIVGADLWVKKTKDAEATILESANWEFVYKNRSGGEEYKYPHSGEEFYLKLKNFSNNTVYSINKIEFCYSLMQAEAAYAEIDEGKVGADFYDYLSTSGDRVQKWNLNVNRDGKKLSTWKSEDESHNPKHYTMYHSYCNSGYYCDACPWEPQCTLSSGTTKCSYCSTSHTEEQLTSYTYVYDLEGNLIDIIPNYETVTVEDPVYHTHNAEPCNCGFGQHWVKKGEEGYHSFESENSYMWHFRMVCYRHQEYEAQDLITIEWGRIWYQYYKFTFEFEVETLDNPPDGDNPPDDGIPLIFDLGGKVWNDRPLNKESVEDGIITKDADGIAKEDGMEGVIVTLYYEDGTKVPDDKIGDGKGNPRKTDKNGEYLFEGLPFGQYYVTFGYDGMNYEPTEYLAACADGCSDKKKCIHNSKAKEDESKRKEFNAKFAQVTPNGIYSSSGSKTCDADYDTSQKDANGYTIIKLKTTNSDGTVKDLFKMEASTQTSEIKSFPLDALYNPSEQDVVIDGNTYYAIYPYMKNINLGLKERDRAYFAVRVNLDQSNIIFNGLADVYDYPRRQLDGEKTFDISARVSGYYQTENINEINPNNANAKLPLEVTVKYTIIVMNKSEKCDGYITELANYYDTDLELIDSTIKGTGQQVEWTSSPEHGNNATMKETNAAYTTSLKGTKIAKNKSITIEATYKVKDPYKLINSGEENINVAEINGYKTVNESGEPAGIIDMYSIPGNAKVGTQSSYENDADEAQLLKLSLGNENDYNYIISGYVWEDIRTETRSSGQLVGDGIRAGNEPNIEGVLVELIDAERQPGEDGYVQPKTTYSDRNGHYEFQFSPTTTYKVRFTYGTGDQLEKYYNGKYNGQDYQVTSYKGSTMDTPEEEEPIINAANVFFMIDISGSMYGTIGIVKKAANLLADQLFATNPKIKIGVGSFDNSAYLNCNLTDDKTTIESSINSLSANGGTETQYGISLSISALQGTENPYMILFTDGDPFHPELVTQAMINCVNAGITPIVILTIPNKSIFEVEGAIIYDINNGDILTTFTEEVFQDITNYPVQTFPDNSCIAIEDKDRRQAAINYSTTIDNAKGEILSLRKDKLRELGNNTYIIANTVDNILITPKHDNTKTQDKINLGLVERPKTKLELTEKIKSLEIILSDGTKLIDTSKATTGVNNWKNGEGTRKNGVISAYIDEELMQGATVKITYGITVTNNSEIDTGLLYQGLLGNENTIVTTRANKIYTYISENLVYREEDNRGSSWKLVDNPLSGSVLNVGDDIGNFQVLQNNKDFKQNLKPGAKIEKELVLTKVIAPENTGESLEYVNSSEIVEIGNTAGRKNTDAIPGNYNPLTGNKLEIDTAEAREIRLLPPFGEIHIFYIIGAISAIILVAGIIIIKKKVLK